MSVLPEINLIDSEGFQSTKPLEEIPEVVEPKEQPALKAPPPPPKPVKKAKKMKKKKKKPAIPFEKVFTIVTAVGIGILIIWYLMVRSHITLDVKEFTPSDFKAYSESLTDSPTEKP